MASLAQSGSAGDGPKEHSDNSDENRETREGASTNQGKDTTSEASEPEKDSCDEKSTNEEPKHLGPPKGLPPIDLDELNTVLRHPNMPSKKILHEVADKVISGMNRDEDRVREMKGLFDCILEVSLKHTEESDNSDDEDEGDESFHLEFPCVYCQKVFLSSMQMKTHVLVLHSKEDPSVLNLRKKVASDCQRISQGHRNRSQDSARVASDAKEKPPQSLRAEDRPTANVGDENVPVSHQLSLRSHPKLSKSPAARGGASLPESQSKSKGLPSAGESSVPDKQTVKRSSELPVADPTVKSSLSVSKDSLQLSTSGSSQDTVGDSGNEETDVSRVTMGQADQMSTSNEQDDHAAGQSECADQLAGSNVSRKRLSTGNEDTPLAAKRERRTRSRQEEVASSNSSRKSSRRL